MSETNKGPKRRPPVASSSEQDEDDLFWPDPTPGCVPPFFKQQEQDDDANCEQQGMKHHTYLNDVSRMSNYPSGTPVTRIFYPRCEADVTNILKTAHKAGKHIGIRGTKHSMGGHSIASQQGWEIDTKYLRHMDYDDKNHPNTVRCGPGCQWADLIQLLNGYGKSPRTMQSYCSFSVGGTLAVNAHGITTDYCFAESVLEMRLARVNHKGDVEIVSCRSSKKGKMNQAKGKGEELFSLALGGYGLFGVITEVVLKVESNRQLQLDSMQLSVQTSYHNDGNTEFVRIYDNCRNLQTSPGSDGGRESTDNKLDTSLGKVEMKLARLNTITLEKVSFYVFRSSARSSSISNLPPEPREMSKTSLLLYKWAAPLLKELRYVKEEVSGEALDWSQDDSLTRNQLMFESAVPLSRLYEPLLKKDDTFVLQEFFCPHDSFSQWIENARPIYKEIETQQEKHGQDLILLNTTIRFVERDDITFLSYSRKAEGSFAFVLYYRIKRNEAVEKRLGDFHNQLALMTVKLGGTFYLPYRKCYSPELLKRAYPMIEDFAKKKEFLDPDCLFSNLWFEEYILALCSNEYREKWAAKQMTNDEGNNYGNIELPITIETVSTKKDFMEWLPRKHDQNLVRRTNSYRNLLKSKVLRDQFQHQFLVQIFNLADPGEVMRAMTRAAWDPSNQNDFDIYKYMFNYFNGPDQKKSGFSTLAQYWHGIQQLRQQKEELTRQTLGIIGKLGRLGKINGYVCMGDNGKTIIDFSKKLKIHGKIWVVHENIDVTDSTLEEQNSKKKMPSIGTVLERGSLDSVADEEIRFDYMSDLACEKLARIPSESADLVTMNQGLHHIPIVMLFDFLLEVKRILRPEGIFIIREHDLKMDSNIGKVPYPMLDLAHSIFNAVTGVPIDDELEEIRAFRPVLEWRAILEKVGFADTLLTEVEDGDPTRDEMMAFYKPCATPKKNDVHHIDDTLKLSLSSIDQNDVQMMSLINTLFGQVPRFVVSNATHVFTYVKQLVPHIEEFLHSIMSNEIPDLLKEIGVENARGISKEISNLFETKIIDSFDQIRRFLEGALALISKSEIQDIYNFKGLADTPELYLILPYLQRKIDMEADECNEMERMFINFVKEYFPMLLLTEDVKEHGEIVTIDEAKSSDSKRPQETSSTITGVEVQEILENLAQSIPGLLDPSIVLPSSGFTLPQQTALVSQLGGTNFEEGCETFASYLDRTTWTEMERHLKEVEKRGDLPTRLLLADKSSDHPWHSVFKSFLKSSKMNLSTKGMIGLRLVGLSEIVTLYRKAKDEQKTEKPQYSISNNKFDHKIVSYLSSQDKVLEELSSDWTNDIVQRTITFDKNKETSLWDVAEVISAKFGYKSLTSRKVSITDQLQRIHSQVHTSLANPRDGLSLGESVRLGLRPIGKDLSGYLIDVPANVRLGWLPIDEDLLVVLRNKGRLEKELGDSFRKSVVSAATLGLAGNNQLKITYRKLSYDSQDRNAYRNSSFKSIQSSQSNMSFNSISNQSVRVALDNGYMTDLKIMSRQTCSFLESEAILKKDLHPNGGHYTWFKLNEWMQVEILREMVSSLDHTPWYRFPFMQFLNTYFTVFQKQCQIVRRKYGLLTAYGSMGFLVDAIPGIVMTFLFAQLQLLAAPLKMSQPSDGYAGVDQSKFLEEILLRVHLEGIDAKGNWNEYFATQVDERILKVEVLPTNFIVLTTPPFKAMGEILKKVAIKFPTARVLQISNQQEVQVRISEVDSTQDGSTTGDVDCSSGDLQKILALPGVEKMMHYQYPNTVGSGSSSPPTCVGKTTADNQEQQPINHCLQVHCLSLLDVIRACDALETCYVEQIYDFWN